MNTPGKSLILKNRSSLDNYLRASQDQNQSRQITYKAEQVNKMFS